MKAAYYETFGNADVMQVGELSNPPLSDGQVMIKVAAAGVNPIDWKIRSGAFADVFLAVFPVVPGWDVAGEIVEIGAGVEGFAVGDPVYAYARTDTVQYGTYAELVPVDATQVALAPERLTLREAASIPVVALTAWQALIETADVSSGQTVLVHAGAGGVGSFAIPLAKWRGARVITTASPAKADYVTQLGADVVIDYKRADWADQVREGAPGGVHAILDGVGGETGVKSLDLVNPGGHMVCLNDAPDDAIAAEKSVRLTRLYAAPSGAQLAEIAKLIDQHILPLPPIEVFPLDNAIEAMRKSEGGRTAGKLVIAVDLAL
ncbi:MAG: NADP-dependent oxidoreductase [Pseudomonadota bacterium]